MEIGCELHRELMDGFLNPILDLSTGCRFHAAYTCRPMCAPDIHFATASTLFHLRKGPSMLANFRASSERLSNIWQLSTLQKRLPPYSER